MWIVGKQITLGQNNSAEKSKARAALMNDIQLLMLILLQSVSAMIPQLYHHLFDPDNNSRSNPSDWINYLKRMTDQIRIQDDNFLEVFSQFDVDLDGQITLQQFQNKLKPFIPHYRPGPKQVHISLTNLPDQMQIMWVSKPEVYDFPEVKYTTDITHMNQHIAPANWTTYHDGRLGWHGRIYRTVLKGLIPGQKYYYQVGDFATKMFSQIFHFTQPMPPMKKNSSRLIVYGDMGVIPFGYRVNADIYFQFMTRRVDLVLLAGDIAYAGVSSQQQGEIQPVWDIFGNMIQRWACCMPFMPGLGNHEKYYNYSSYKHRYVLPRNQDTNSNLYFYFDINNLRIIHFSTQHPYQPGSEQYNFIQKYLANSNATWKILACHRPLLSSDVDGFDGHKPGAHLYQTLQPLIVKYKVDIVFTGHEHCYQRNDLMKGNSTEYKNPDQAIYIVQGTAGALIRDKFVQPRPQWAKVRIARYGYGVLQTEGNTLRYQFKLMRSAWVADSWSITKDIK